MRDFILIVGPIVGIICLGNFINGLIRTHPLQALSFLPALMFVVVVVGWALDNKDIK